MDEFDKAYGLVEDGLKGLEKADEKITQLEREVEGLEGRVGDLTKENDQLAARVIELEGALQIAHQWFNVNANPATQAEVAAVLGGVLDHGDTDDGMPF